VNLSFAKIPDIENIIATDLKSFFDSDMPFTSLFPNDTLKVSTDHPFVNLMNQEVPEGGKYSLACLPAVTIIDSNFSKLVEIPTNPQVYEIKPTIINELEQYGRDQFITSKQVLNLLKEKFLTTDVLKADGIETFRRTSISIEIWAANNILKSKIFDLISLYLIGERRKIGRASCRERVFVHV
jgi:hypothetical protein